MLLQPSEQMQMYLSVGDTLTLTGLPTADFWLLSGTTRYLEAIQFE